MRLQKEIQEAHSALRKERERILADESRKVRRHSQPGKGKPCASCGAKHTAEWRYTWCPHCRGMLG